MVIDSSVVIAVLLLEPDADQLLNQLIEAETLYLSAVSLVETAMVIEYKKGVACAKKLDEWLANLSPHYCRIRSSAGQTGTNSMARIR